MRDSFGSLRQPAMRQRRDNNVVFLIEDDSDIANLVRYHLENAGFSVCHFPSAISVMAEALKQDPALFLLDILVPDGNGFELCRHIREDVAFSRTPVIFLTAKSDEAERVRGLEMGGDDYIVKPFSPRELVARVRAVLRATNPELPTAMIAVGELQIDPVALTLKVAGKLVVTTMTEFRLLYLLAAHPGRVFSRDQLLDSAWSDTCYVTPRSVDVYVHRLREKIEPDPQNPTYLKTAYGVGYKFDPK